MNLMLLDYNKLNKFEKITLRCVIAYYMRRKPLITADDLPINFILIQDLEQVTLALRKRMSSGPIRSETTLLGKLEALRNFENKKEIKKRRRSLINLPAGLRPFLAFRTKFVKGESNDE